MTCMGSSNTCLMGTSSDHWHTKPTEEETLFFHHCSSTPQGIISHLNCLSLPFCMVFTRVAVYRDPVKFEYDSSGVLCMWLGWSMGVRGGGLEGYVFCCDNLRYGFPFFFFFFFKSSLSGFIIALNAFDVLFILFFILMSLNRGMMYKSMSIA